MGIQLKRILVPIDFSDHSRLALEFAGSLAEQFDAEIELVHVVEKSPYEVYQKSGFMHSGPVYTHVGEAAPRSDPQLIIHDVLEETRNHLVALAGSGENTRVEVLHGHVVSELLTEINKYRPDMVVVCTHGVSAIRHMMMGSVAEKLVRLSPAPVLCFRGPE